MPRSLGKKPVGFKHVLEIKYILDGEVNKYEVRLVAQNYLQQEEADYNYFFAPVADVLTSAYH